MSPVVVRNRLYWLVLFTLMGVTACLFAPALGFEATNYDDPNYVFTNPPVLAGLTGEGFTWAFTSGHAANWHPLTWLSHMLDVEIFGDNPGGHHATNVLLHTLNTGLVLALFYQLTRRLWPSAFIAALFAWHPLHVESVAWIAERKDVLSGFFGLLTLWAYAHYLQKARAAESAPCALWAETKNAVTNRWYWLALLFFALGLMSKPMLVTLPVVMLLFDFLWVQTAGGSEEKPEPPVEKVRFRFNAWLLWEKAPFLLLALACGVVTLLVQGKGGAVRSVVNFSLEDRFGNALIATVLYLQKTLWPASLAAFYPLPEKISLLTAALAALILAAVTAWTLRTASQTPFRLTGWFWFLIMLAPVIGIVQVGMQQMADRYTYLPLLGIFFWLACEAKKLMERLPRLQTGFIIAGVTLPMACAITTHEQLAHWRTSETLFRHAIAVTKNNYLAHNNLGYHLFTQGKVKEAIAEYETALRINPGYTDAASNLGRALAEQARYAEAAEQFRAVLRVLPDDVIAHNNLGNVLAILGQNEEAILHFSAAVTARPDHASAHNNWALSAEQLGRPGEAIAHYREALRYAPGLHAALNNLAWLLATCPDDSLRNGPEAFALAQQACRVTDCTQPLPLLTLAAATAEIGQFTDAITLATQALEGAQAGGSTPLVERAQAMLAQFREQKPFRVVLEKSAQP